MTLGLRGTYKRAVPKDLVALLREDGAAPAEAIERALERQREAGGALDTALLETGALSEEALVAFLARAAELPAAPESAWSGDDARARRVFPSRVAERHGLAPFALEGRELSLVATYPVDMGLLDEISFMLSLHLTAHVGPEWRVRELIHRMYGAPLPPRLAAIAAGGGRPPAETPEAGGPAEGDRGGAEEGRPAPAVTGFARDEGEPLEPLAAALQQALDDVDFSIFEEGEPEAPGAEAPGEAEAGAAEDEGAGEEEEAAGEEDRPPPDRTAPPRWTLEDAQAAMAASRHRDEVVLAVLRYARDFFEYASLFAVTRDAVAGHDALGATDEERERVRAFAVWASDPGIFKTVIETRSPYLGPVSPEIPGNEPILTALGRGSPRTALVHPVLLRDRVVCVVYADNGEAPVSARRLGDLAVLLAAIGPAFERIIRDRKKTRRRRRLATPPPAAPIEAAEDAPASEAEAASLPADEPQGAYAAPLEQAAAPAPSADASERFGPEAAGEPSSPDPGPPAAPGSLSEIEASFFSVGEEAPPAAAEPEPAPPAEPEPAPPPEAPPEPPRAASPPEPAPPPPPEPTADPSRTQRLPAPAPAAAAPATPAVLADRALDPDPETAAAACAALAERRRDPGLRAACEKLRRALLSGIADRATRAARALGAIRDVDSIPLLIQVLETSEPETASASAGALEGITLQRIGPDARKWLAWWKENRGRGRAEWLFSGLTSADRETRVAAAVELSAAAPPPVAYSADLAPADRERIARAWAGWWARSGHVL